MGLRYLIEFNVIIYLICFNLCFIVFLFDKKKKNYKVGKYEFNVFFILIKFDELIIVNIYGKNFYKIDSLDDGK